MIKGREALAAGRIGVHNEQKGRRWFASALCNANLRLAHGPKPEGAFST
jgi:hypothetical protein